MDCSIYFKRFRILSLVSELILFIVDCLTQFLPATVVSILLYGCTTSTLAKQMEKRLDCNSTRMLPAILNKSWRQHPTKQQLYGQLPPITKTIKVRRGVMVIVAGYGHGDTSSNPGPD